MEIVGILQEFLGIWESLLRIVMIPGIAAISSTIFGVIYFLDMTSFLNNECKKQDDSESVQNAHTSFQKNINELGIPQLIK